jgi:predicted dehydrogenase
LSRYTAAIIGLGQIGQGYDYSNSNSDLVLTHATALQLHHDFEVIAAVDPSQTQQDKFRDKFLISTFNNLQNLYLECNPDIVVIAAPIELHVSVFLEVIKHSPKAIVLEKPVADDYINAKALLKVATEKKCPVSVNYLRRFNPALKSLKNIIARKELGNIYKGTAWYTKGVINGGSHFIDLFIWLLGDVTSIEVLNSKRAWNDVDPEPDLYIRFGNTDMYMFSGHEESFYMGKFELIGDGGAAFYEDGKSIEVHLSENDPVYENYKELVKNRRIENSIEKDMLFGYDNLSEHLGSGKELTSSIKTATNTMLVVHQILEKIRTL